MLQRNQNVNNENKDVDGEEKRTSIRWRVEQDNVSVLDLTLQSIQTVIPWVTRQTDSQQ